MHAHPCLTAVPNVPMLVLYCHPAHNAYASRLSAGKGDCGVDMADMTRLLSPGLHSDKLPTTCKLQGSYGCHPDNHINLAVSAPCYVLSSLS